MPANFFIVKSIWENESFDFKGEYYTIEDGRVSEPPNPLPEFYFGGRAADRGRARRRLPDLG